MNHTTTTVANTANDKQQPPGAPESTEEVCPNCSGTGISIRPGLCTMCWGKRFVPKKTALVRA